MSPAFLNLKNLNKRHQMETTLCCLLLKLFIAFFSGFFCVFFSFSLFLRRVGFLGKKSPCSKNSPFKKEREREKFKVLVNSERKQSQVVKITNI